MDVHPKRSVKLPAVPPEIWICVFQHATYVPGILDPEVYAEYSPVKPPQTKDRHAALREALLTKRALVRVCKQWYHLAIPYLYRSVYIGRARSIRSLRETFKASATDKDRHPLGAYTQRLDVAIRDHAEENAIGYPRSDELKLWCLADLISLMTNLTIVTFAITPNFASSLQDNIIDALEHSASSLRVLDFASNTYEPRAARLASLLTKCHRLRVLTCHTLSWSNDQTHCYIPPSVTTLRVGHLDTLPAGFPPVTSSFNREETPRSALRELTIGGQKDQGYWDNFLRCYSNQLHSLQFWIPQNRSIDVPESLRDIARTCPNLRRLIITGGFPAIAHPNPILPPITYLGLRAISNQCPKSDFVTLFAFLEELRTSVPSLQVVQLLSKYNVECLLKGHAKLAARAVKPYLEADMFRIEDQDGVLLADTLKELGHL